MANTIFPYPGGKSKYADWIVEQMPEHETYIEAFGGGAGVLINKPRSTVEVYNDINKDVVTFFRVLRNRGGELSDFVSKMPYSRSEYKRISEAWYADGKRPEDDLKRAAWFYYLQHTSFSGKLERSGFSTDATKKGDRARAYSNNTGSLETFTDRFDEVTIECLDYRRLVDRYDSPKTLFYFDPPYLEVGDDYYNHKHDFDHKAFVELLRETQADWIVSYNELPDGLDEYPVATRETRYSMSSQKHTYKTERLVMNYNPKEKTSAQFAAQTSIEYYD